MNVEVRFRDELVNLEVPEDRLLGCWDGPPGLPPSEVGSIVSEALETPIEFPPLRRAVVAGDRLLVALDPHIPCLREVLGAIARVLEPAGIEPEMVTVLIPSAGGEGLAEALPRGWSLVVHDPEDRAGLAYLASTRGERRVYLNRLLTDADFVLPVGLLGYDPALGYHGPWSTLFPGFSNLETRRAFRDGGGDEAPDPDAPTPALAECAEVSWLLGSQFQVAIAPGRGGVAAVVAGEQAAVRREGARALDRLWTFTVESRAELVVMGVGRPGVPTPLDDLAGGLHTASRLVQRGGKVVILSHVEGPIGPALRRWIEADDPRAGPAVLRGQEAAPDYPTARALARTLGWADVYLLGDLGRDLVEDLSMISLDRPSEVRRLLAAAHTAIVLSEGERTRASVRDDS